MVGFGLGSLTMRLPLSTLALTLALAACGGNSTPADVVGAAETALQKGDSAKAVELLQKHVPTLEQGSAAHKGATILLCSALAEKEPTAARDTLLAFAAAHSAVVTPRDFKDVQSYLQTHEHYSVAVDVMDAGLKRWKDDPTMLEVKDVLIARIQSVGDAESMAKLKGLGYM